MVDVVRGVGLVEGGEGFGEGVEGFEVFVYFGLSWGLYGRWEGEMGSGG